MLSPAGSETDPGTQSGLKYLSYTVWVAEVLAGPYLGSQTESGNAALQGRALGFHPL